jgi:hypothetical protein
MAVKGFALIQWVCGIKWSRSTWSSPPGTGKTKTISGARRQIPVREEDKDLCQWLVTFAREDLGMCPE